MMKVLGLFALVCIVRSVQGTQASVCAILGLHQEMLQPTLNTYSGVPSGTIYLFSSLKKTLRTNCACDLLLHLQRFVESPRYCPRWPISTVKLVVGCCYCPQRNWDRRCCLHQNPDNEVWLCPWTLFCFAGTKCNLLTFAGIWFCRCLQRTPFARLRASLEVLPPVPSLNIIDFELPFSISGLAASSAFPRLDQLFSEQSCEENDNL